MYIYGHTIDEIYPAVGLPAAIKASFKVEGIKVGIRRGLAPTHVELAGVASCALPTIAEKHSATTLGGVIKRLAVKPVSKMTRAVKRRFKRYVRLFVSRTFEPIAHDADISSRTWLEKTTYTRGRKNQLLTVIEQLEERYGTLGQDLLNKIPSRYFKLNTFVKKEFYPELKHARLINSRTDQFKTLVGPIFQMIYDELIAKSLNHDGTPQILKKIDPVDRPMVLSSIFFPGATYYDTDHTSFESHFTPEVYQCCEFEFYKHMASALPRAVREDFIGLIRKALLGTNMISLGEVLVSLIGTRMSGEMNTSLGNTFTNIMILKFLVYEKDPSAKVHCFVEGDDALYRVNPESAAPTEKEYFDLGWNIKLGRHTELNEASFCGMVFDPQNLGAVLCDPTKKLLTTPWISSQYAESRECVLETLLVAKAYSLMAYPGCPVVAPMSRWIIRNYKFDEEIFLRYLSTMTPYERDKMVEVHSFRLRLVETEISMSSREIVERKFGMSIQEQLQLEKFFDTAGRSRIPTPTTVPTIIQGLFLSHSSVVNDRWNCIGGDRCIKMEKFFDNVKQLVGTDCSIVGW